MHEFGEKVGIAFQIKDDLFDYGLEEIGKPLGIDIREKKMTLPLIYALRNTSWMNRRKFIYIIRNKSHKPKKVAEVIDFVKQSGGIEYANEIMNQTAGEAISLLDDFNDSLFKNSLKDMVRFTIERSR
jgi:octaprenyl-diphosphate synthase